MSPNCKSRLKKLRADYRGSDRPYGARLCALSHGPGPMGILVCKLEFHDAVSLYVCSCYVCLNVVHDDVWTGSERTRLRFQQVTARKTKTKDECPTKFKYFVFRCHHDSKQCDHGLRRNAVQTCQEMFACLPLRTSGGPIARCKPARGRSPLQNAMR